MNILFFITPKSETAYLYDDCSLRQAIEKIEYHKYTAVPVLNKKGCYVGTLTEGGTASHLGGTAGQPIPALAERAST